MTRIGLLGAGRIAHAHAASLLAPAVRDRGATVTWVADPVPEAAERLAGLTGARATADPAEVIGSSDVDAVLICSPTPTHVEAITACLGAGKPALCEKPIDLSLARADELLTEVGGRDVPVMMGFNRRFDPSFAAVHRRVTAGELGAVEQMLVVSRDPAPPPVPYIAVSGGIFRDMSIHDLDMVRFFLPDIVEVEAVGQNVIDDAFAEHDDYDGAVLTLRSAGGAVATIVNSRRCAFGYDQRLEVFGERGMLQAGNQTPTSVRSFGAEHAEQTDAYLPFFLERYAAAYAAELVAFLDAVDGNGTFSPSLHDGREALALAVAAGQAARTGTRVRVEDVRG